MSFLNINTVRSLRSYMLSDIYKLIIRSVTYDKDQVIFRPRVYYPGIDEEQIRFGNIYYKRKLEQNGFQVKITPRTLVISWKKS